MSLLLTFAQDATTTSDLAKEVENEGLDISEHGSIAYPGKRIRELDEDK